MLKLNRKITNFEIVLMFITGFSVMFTITLMIESSEHIDFIIGVMAHHGEALEKILEY